MMAHLKRYQHRHRSPRRNHCGLSGYLWQKLYGYLLSPKETHLKLVSRPFIFEASIYNVLPDQGLSRIWTHLEPLSGLMKIFPPIFLFLCLNGKDIYQDPHHHQRHLKHPRTSNPSLPVFPLATWPKTPCYPPQAVQLKRCRWCRYEPALTCS